MISGDRAMYSVVIERPGGALLVIHQLPDILGLFRLHEVQEFVGLLLRQFPQEVGGLVGGHLLQQVRGLLAVHVLQDFNLGVQLHFGKGLGRHLHIQVIDKVGPFLVIQVLDDIRQVGRVEFIELGPFSAKLQGRGLFFEMGDVLPPDEVVFQPLEERLHPQAPGQAPHADVHRHGYEVAAVAPLKPEQLDVIDPDDLGAPEVDDLLVHEPLAHVNIVGVEGNEFLFLESPRQADAVLVHLRHLVDGDMAVDAPGKLDTGYPGRAFSFPPYGQIDELTDALAVNVLDGLPLDLAEEEFPHYM